MNTVFKRFSAAFAALAVMAAVALDTPITITANAAGGCSYHDTSWNGEAISADGNYYLDGEVGLLGEIEISNKVTLCLNGHTITAASGSRVFTIKNSGSLTICDCGNTGTITGGKATEGGGVYTAGTFIMNGGTISGNEASHQGGGVYVNGDGTFTMNGGKISANTISNYADTTYGGGGVYTEGTFTITGGTVSGNSAAVLNNNNRAQGFGGGVCVGAEKAVFNMEGGTLSGNSAQYGGGVHVSKGTFNMQGGTIGNGNTATGGGGVSVGGGDFNMDGGTISGNTGGGAGVYLSSGAFTMTNGTITQNTSGQGGGIQMGGGVLTLNGPVTIANNPSGKTSNPESNIYLRAVSKGASTCHKITIGADFNPKTVIGVHVEPTIGCQVDIETTQFAAGAEAKNIQSHFKPDDKKQVIKYNEDDNIIRLFVEHDYGDWETVTAPGIGTTGLKRRVCKNEPTHVQEEELAALTNITQTKPPVNNNDDDDDDDDYTPASFNSQTIVYKDPPTGISLSLAPPALAIAAIAAALIRRKK